MPFDLARFEAEVALKLIPTERLPAIAQDALEAGYDGPHVLRMAILEPTAGWAIDQQLPLMLTELGCSPLPAEEAAMRLARQRAQHILTTNEDPMPSIPYFYRLLWMGDYPEELIELGYFDDNTFANRDEEQACARESLLKLLSPELRQRRIAERKAAREREWPYVLNSPTGRAVFIARYKERLTKLGPFLLFHFFASSLFAWEYGAWRTAIIGYILTVPVLLALPLWVEYRKMVRERRDTLLRRRVPEDPI